MVLEQRSRVVHASGTALHVLVLNKFNHHHHHLNESKNQGMNKRVNECIY